MSKTYIILAVILLVVAFGLVILPSPNSKHEINPELLLQKINNPSRYLSPDQIAERIINEDPSIMLIDVRDEESFNNFSLPGAYNIPLAQITDSIWGDYLSADNMDIILYSNGDIKSDQAWIIATRMNYHNLYVMKGGINQWFDDIMQPSPPEETASSAANDRYSFRLAASRFFGGGSSISTATQPEKQKAPLVKRKKKAAAAGGC